MDEIEEKTLNSLVPLGLIHAFQAWFRRFQASGSETTALSQLWRNHRLGKTATERIGSSPSSSSDSEKN